MSVRAERNFRVDDGPDGQYRLFRCLHDVERNEPDDRIRWRNARQNQLLGLIAMRTTLSTYRWAEKRTKWRKEENKSLFILPRSRYIYIHFRLDGQTSLFGRSSLTAGTWADTFLFGQRHWTIQQKRLSDLGFTHTQPSINGWRFYFWVRFQSFRSSLLAVRLFVGPAAGFDCRLSPFWLGPLGPDRNNIFHPKAVDTKGSCGANHPKWVMPNNSASLAKIFINNIQKIRLWPARQLNWPFKY